MKLFKLSIITCILGFLLLTCGNTPQPSKEDVYTFEITSVSWLNGQHDVVEAEPAIGTLKFIEDANFYSIEFTSINYYSPVVYFLVTESSYSMETEYGKSVLHLSGYSVGDDSYDYEWVIRFNEDFIDFTTKRLMDNHIFHIDLDGSYLD